VSLGSTGAGVRTDLRGMATRVPAFRANLANSIFKEWCGKVRPVSCSVSRVTVTALW